MKLHFRWFTMTALILAGASASVHASDAATEKTNFPTESRSLATLADRESLEWANLAKGRLAYKIKSSGRGFVVVDGKPGSEFDDMGDPTFSPDGKYLGYVAVKGRELRGEVMPMGN